MSTRELTRGEDIEMQRQIDDHKARMDKMEKMFSIQMTINEKEKKEDAKRVAEMKRRNEILEARLKTVERDQQEALQYMRKQLKDVRDKLRKADITIADLRKEIGDTHSRYKILIEGMKEEHRKEMLEIIQKNADLRAKEDKFMKLIEGNEELKKRVSKICGTISVVGLGFAVFGVIGAIFAGSGPLCTFAIAVAAVSFFSSLVSASLFWYFKQKKAKMA